MVVLHLFVPTQHRMRQSRDSFHLPRSNSFGVNVRTAYDERPLLTATIDMWVRNEEGVDQMRKGKHVIFTTFLSPTLAYSIWLLHHLPVSVVDYVGYFEKEAPSLGGRGGVLWPV
eukprot:scaffold358_cov109-Cylindrotheca_fusiformis.AAC.2